MAVLHESTTFVIASDTGDIDSAGGGGLYYEDIRCLSLLRLRLEGHAPVSLLARSTHGNRSLHVLTNAALRSVPAQTLAIVRRRELGDGLHESLAITNHGDDEAVFTLSLELAADFADLYEVKRTLKRPQQPPHGHARLEHDDGDPRVARLTLDCPGGPCTTRLRFGLAPRLSPRGPQGLADAVAEFDVRLAPKAIFELPIDVCARLPSDPPERLAASPLDGNARRAAFRRERLSELRGDMPQVETDHKVLGKACSRAARDLESLRLKTEQQGQEHAPLAAGIPWYMALFGRDSLIASYQSMLHDPALARGTLRALAALQGRRVDRETEEEPGKILHEHRPALARSVRRHIPRFPYYGTVDATPLFVIVLSEYVRVTGDLALARELSASLDAALEWIARFGDKDGDGLVEYEVKPGDFVPNKGWKDSPDSVRFRDGRIAKGPIALVEVQGYVADALARAAELVGLLGRDGDRVASLTARSREMKQRLLARYLLPDRGTFAEALDGEKRKVDALTSNPGHLLWARAIPHEAAKGVACALLGEAMWSGWGVRTMGAAEGGFNPTSYHNGSVWPHDNGLFLEGLSRYGLSAEVARVASGLVDAIAACPDYVPPELFAGFAREETGAPVSYPNANRPQAWASGAVLSIARSLAGIEVDAPGRSLSIAPTLLSEMSWMKLSRLPIGGGRVTVELVRGAHRIEARVEGLPAGWSWRREGE